MKKEKKWSYRYDRVFFSYCLDKDKIADMFAC